MYDIVCARIGSRQPAEIIWDITKQVALLSDRDSDKDRGKFEWLQDFNNGCIVKYCLWIQRSVQRLNRTSSKSKKVAVVGLRTRIIRRSCVGMYAIRIHATQNILGSQGGVYSGYHIQAVY